MAKDPPRRRPTPIVPPRDSPSDPRFVLDRPGEAKRSAASMPPARPPARSVPPALPNFVVESSRGLGGVKTSPPIRGGEARASTDAESATDADTEAGESAAKSWTDITVQMAPPWLVSLVVHMLLILIMALWYLPEEIVGRLVVNLDYAEQLGEQLVDDSVVMGSLEPLQVPDPEFSAGLQPVDDPLASPPEFQLRPDALPSAVKVDAPAVGLALSGREKGAKEALLAAYGGTATTESAVRLGLEWLARNRQRDGSWRLDGPYADGVDGIPNPTAATAMALLAFQGNGHTHRDGEHQDVVAKAMQVLLQMQDPDGNFLQKVPNHHRLYSQAMATIAVCELYGMTRDPQLREPAQRALDYAAKIQADDGSGGGGWRYNPGQDVDTSVTGWFVMALQSGKMAGLGVTSPALDKVSIYLDHVTRDGSRYSYRPGENEKPSMTAEALLCRQYLGWSRDSAQLVAGVNYLLEHPIDFEEADVYYWYYATQVTHHMGGEYWDRWNAVMRQAVPERQVANGKERGSWDPRGDPYGYQGGRLYMTCFCIYMLEVYYRHLPIYQRVRL